MIGNHEKRLSSDKLTRSSKILKSDHPEKDRFRSSLNLMEQDRHYLLESLRDLQKRNEVENEKNFELGRNLSYQADHIRQLESEKASLTETLKNLQSKLEELENAHSNLVQDRSSLKMLLAQMQEEIHINRLQASDKELYIEKLASSYNEEKETILNVHSKHSRLLTSKLLCDAVGKFVLNKKSWAFFGLREKIGQKVAIGRLGFRFLVKCFNKRVRTGFKALKVNVRDLRVEKIMEKFVDKRRLLRIKKKVVEKMRELKGIRKKMKERVEKGMNKVKIVDKVRVKVRVLRFLTQWKNVKVKDLYGKRIILGLIMKKYVKSLAIYLKQWGNISKLLKQIQANEDLASDLSGFALKQGVFYEFKRVAQLASIKKKFKIFVARLQVHKNKQKVLTILKTQKLIQISKKNRLLHLCLHFANKSLKTSYLKWQSYISSAKQTSSISKLFKTHNKKNSFFMVNKLFLAWKVFINKNKHLKASKTLANEIPQREGYEKAYTELLTYNQEVLITKSLKNIMKSGNNIIRSYFFTWQSVVYGFNRSKKCIGKHFVQVYTGQVKEAFDKWKDFRRVYEINSLLNNNEEAYKENQVLLEHINNLDICLKATTESKSFVSVLNMAKCIKNIIRLSKVSNFRRWGQNALRVSNYHSGAAQLANTFFHYLLKESFFSLKSFNERKANKGIRQKKLYFFTFKKWKKINSCVLQHWTNFIRLNKYHRSKLSIVLIKKYRKTAGFCLTYWNNWLKDLLIVERDVQFEVLDNECNQVREELEDVCNSLSIEKEQTWRLQEFIKYKKLKRGFLTLCSISAFTVSAGLKRWKFFLHTARLQSKYSRKMINYYTRLDLKNSFKTWNFFKICSIKASNCNNVNQLISEKKSLRRDLNSMKTSLELDISEKESKIQQHIAHTQELKGKIKKMFNISVRKQNDTVVVPRTHFLFSYWKAGYVEKKKSLAKLIKLVKFAKLGKGFLGVKSFAIEVARQKEIFEKIIRFLLSFRGRKLKNSFRQWIKNSFRIVQGDQSKEIQYFNSKLSALGIRYESSKKNSINKALKFINDKKKLALLQGWKKVTKKLKTLKEASTYYERLTSAMKAKYGLDEWKFFKIKKQRNKEFSHIMMISRLEKLKNLTFSLWKNTHLIGKTVEKGLEKVNFHLTRDHKFFSFSCLKSYTASKKTYMNWFEYTRLQLLKNSFTLFRKQETFQYFSIWLKKSEHISSILKKLQKILNTTENRIQSKGFRNWITSLVLIKTVEKVENFGKSAKKVRKLQSTLAVLQKFIKKEGLSSRYLEEYLMQLLPVQHFLSLKCIDKSDRLYFRFIIWKIFVLKRQKFRSASLRMCIFKHKGLLVQRFLQWKRACPSFSSSIQTLPRVSLIETLTILNRDMKFLTESLKEKHVSLKYLESYTEILEEHVRRGQNQALANCATNIKKTLQTCLFRWFFNTQTSRIVENDFQIRDLEEELVYIRRKCKDFDVENKDLVIENKGLLNALMKAEDLIMKTQF